MDTYSLTSYAQEAEDLILYRIFGEKKNGFFVDIGAYHPIKYSNTFFFYNKGWRGVNIDAMPDSMKLFQELRPQDTNIEIAVGQESKEVDFYIFNEPALNCLDKELAQERDEKPNQFKLVKTQKVKVMPLSEVLKNACSIRTEIDFMSIDVEGEELSVLRSNDWHQYRPKVLLVEFLESTLESIIDDPISTLLKDEGYVIFAKSFNTVFYMTQEFFNKRMGI